MGVLQGSALGQLLFLIYTNDLPRAVLCWSMSMYADDTSLYLKSQNISQITMTMNKDLEDLNFWLEGSKLSPIVVKTQSMLIATESMHQTLNNAAEKLKLDFLGNEFYVVTKARYLAVQVDYS